MTGSDAARPASWVNGAFTVTCDPAKMDRAAIAGFLASTYWAKGIPAATVDKALALQGLRRWILATQDAHGLYERFGFTPLKKPASFMERHDPDVYARLDNP